MRTILNKKNSQFIQKDIMTNLLANWSFYVEEIRVNRRLQEVKCFVDDLRCSIGLDLTNKEALQNYLQHNFPSLSVNHVAKYLGTKFLIANDITPLELDENVLFEKAYQLDDQYRDYLSNTVNPINESWDHWRRSQSQRFKEEDISIRASKITYIAFAIELTKGCSGGCHFCGFSASKLLQNQPNYSQNNHTFKMLLRELASIAGKEYGKTGILYWATDPLDHPEYFLYARDFCDEFGIYPHMTSAIAENKIPLIKEIIGEQIKLSNRPWGIRCSLRSSSAYEKLRSHLTLAERSFIQMNPQYMGKQNSYARSGRAFKNSTKSDQEIHGGTIACMTGFLVSLAEANIKLITPCIADEYNINGYRVLNNTPIGAATTIRKTLLKSLKITDEPTISDDTMIKFNASYDILRYYKTIEGFPVPRNISSLRIPVKFFFNLFANYSADENIRNLLFKMLGDGVAIVDS